MSAPKQHHRNRGLFSIARLLIEGKCFFKNVNRFTGIALFDSQTSESELGASFSSTCLFLAGKTKRPVEVVSRLVEFRAGQKCIAEINHSVGGEGQAVYLLRPVDCFGCKRFRFFS